VIIMISLEDLTVGQVSGIIAAAVFIGKTRVKTPGIT